MFTNEKDFLTNGIGPLLVDQPNLHVVFATYRTVGEYPDGPVETGKDGLTIQVQSGHLKAYSLFGIAALLSSNQNVNMMGADSVVEEGKQAQKIVASSIDSRLAETDTPELYFIYAGLTAFDSAIYMVRDLRRKRPNAKIIITTCDCDLSDKENKLNPMIEKGEVEAVVVTYYCGGQELMSSILEKVIEKFPAPNQTNQEDKKSD